MVVIAFLGLVLTVGVQSVLLQRAAIREQRLQTEARWMRIEAQQTREFLESSLRAVQTPSVQPAGQ
jgi:hypothetical protein